jgi:Transposase DDE domain
LCKLLTLIVKDRVLPLRIRHRGVVDEIERAKNRTKSRVRAKVEHTIGVIKRVFGFSKVRYAGWRRTLIAYS